MCQRALLSFRSSSIALMGVKAKWGSIGFPMRIAVRSLFGSIPSHSSRLAACLACIFGFTSSVRSRLPALALSILIAELVGAQPLSIERF
jgi:hypothetical protein